MLACDSSTLRAAARLGSVAGVLLVSAACDYSGDFLFGGAIEGAPGVVDLGMLTPVDIVDSIDINNGTVYAELGPTGSAEPGGATFTFLGTGGHVCLWVDPELVYWSQSVASRRPDDAYAYPDNVFDDGDVDLFAGFAAYYTGSPGEAVGDFKVRYQDSLGNPVEIELNECGQTSLNDPAGGHAGRGFPEHCTISNTQVGVEYLGLLSTWSTPLDDDRLGYGLLVANGDCDDVMSAGRVDSVASEECLIQGEAIRPGDTGPWTGIGSVPSLAGSIDFEEAFCAGQDAEYSVSDFCREEAGLKDCATEHCFCGDPANTPTPGGF